MNGEKLYKKIAERKTLNQRWNDLPDSERLALYRLAQGVEALVRVHNAHTADIAKYLMQYVKVKNKGEQVK